MSINEFFQGLDDADLLAVQREMDDIIADTVGDSPFLAGTIEKLIEVKIRIALRQHCEVCHDDDS